MKSIICCLTNSLLGCSVTLHLTILLDFNCIMSSSYNLLPNNVSMVIKSIPYRESPWDFKNCFQVPIGVIWPFFRNVCIILFTVVWCKSIPTFFSSSDIFLHPQRRLSCFISRISFLIVFVTWGRPFFLYFGVHLLRINFLCQERSVWGVTIVRWLTARLDKQVISEIENLSWNTVLIFLFFRFKCLFRISFSFFSRRRGSIISFFFLNDILKNSCKRLRQNVNIWALYWIGKVLYITVCFLCWKLVRYIKTTPR